VLSRDRKKKVHLADSLPPVLAADIVARDGDGELIATPSDWNEAVGAAPKILLRSSRRAKAGTKAGLGDRVLLRDRTR
jgi:ribonuclease R